MRMMPSSFAFALAVAIATPAAADMVPLSDRANPRLQSVEFRPGETVQLTVLPGAGLTVVLEPGERIEAVSLGDESAFDLRISPGGDGFVLLPRSIDGRTGLAVTTDRRNYTFGVTTLDSLAAAYLVEFDYGDAPGSTYEPTGETWAYRLKGDAIVRPATISDDGVKTWIAFAPDQALPAIFAIGPTGDEEVVNGHMRNDVYVIDRVHRELVFRIDKEKATAQRNSQPEARQ